MATRLSTVEIFKENMKFVAGHYTIFSATERERLHGHTFNVYAAITSEVNDNGLTCDYHVYKEKVRQLCRDLNEYFLIAGQSPYQELKPQGEHLYVHYGEEIIPFLQKDVKVLPIRNTTVEELSHWFLEQLIADMQLIRDQKIHALEVKVYSGPGQCASASWRG